jgi:hypothetical protein
MQWIWTVVALASGACTSRVSGELRDPGNDKPFAEAKISLVDRDRGHRNGQLVKDAEQLTVTRNDAPSTNVK